MTAGDPVGLGVLGARAMIFERGLRPAIEAAEGVELVAVAARSGPVPEGLDALDVGGYEEVIDHPDVEAVYLPLPNGAHVPWTERAAAAGKHVLCEKPLAPTPDQARSMADACEAAGVVLAEAWMTPFDRRWRQAMELVSNGGIGEVRHIDTSFSHIFPTDVPNYRWDPDEGGGALLDVGIYALGPSVTLWGAAPAEVSASVRVTDRGVDATTSVHLVWPGCRSASALVSFELPEQQRIQVVGTEGRLVLDGPAHTGGPEATEIHLQDRDGDWHVMTTDGGAPYRMMVEAFGRAVRGTEPWPRSPARAIELAELLDRIAKAAT
ncbi:MAG: Gfo/Idh/MocA family oxidoreductase [Actinomycetota bacterium]